MSKFKVGDKVVRKEGMGKDTFFQERLGSKIYYVVTSVSSGGGGLLVATRRVV